jgi:hypothetical protein
MTEFPVLKFTDSASVQACAWIKWSGPAAHLPFTAMDLETSKDLGIQSDRKSVQLQVIM